MVTSILDIDVNDSRFKDFQQSFVKYHEMLDKMPAKWTQAKNEADGVLSTVEKLLAAVTAQQAVIGKSNTTFHQTTSIIGSTTLAMGSLVRESASFARNIVSATTSMLKWGGILGFAGGLLGAGGLWGIDRLAYAAGGVRRSSLGLGTTSGEQQAFRVNYGRLVDSDQLLGNVADARADWSRRWAFNALGINGVEKKSPADIASEAIGKAREMMSHGELTTQRAQATGLLEIFGSMDNLRRILNAPAGVLETARQGYQRDRSGLNVNGDMLDKWATFTAQLERAGTQIENVFIKGLVPLAGPLGSLSASLATAAETILSNPHMGEWITSLGKGIETAAKYLGGDQFIGDLKKFGDEISSLVEGLKNAAAWFGNLFPSRQPPVRRATGEMEGVDPSRIEISDPVTGGRQYQQENPYTFILPGGQAPGDIGLLQQTRAWLGRHHFGQSGIDEYGRKKEDVMRDLELSRGLPPGLLGGTYAVESDSGRNLSTSAAGAKGHFQFMDATARQYGVNDPMNFGQSARGAADYYQDLLAEFHNNVRQAIAAYNWGPGNVENDIRQHGADWERYLPGETRNQVNKVAGAVTIIKIENNTGGSAIVTTSQLAVPQ